MSDKQYNPVACEHKHPNGFSAWSFQSEEQSNLGGANKVSIHVCLLCGEISIGGYRPSKDEKHTNSFHEMFNVYHPNAIDAIIKQANYYNEQVKWGRILPSESDGVKGQSAGVWVKTSDFKYIPGIAYHAKDSKSKGAGRFSIAGDFVWGDNSITYAAEQHDLFILDESPAAQPNKEDAVSLTLEAINTLKRALDSNPKYKKTWQDYIELSTIEGLENLGLDDKVIIAAKKGIAQQIFTLFDPVWWKAQKGSTW